MAGKRLSPRKRKEAMGCAKLTILILQKNDEAQKLIDQAKILLIEAGILQAEMNRRTPLADHIKNI